MKSRFRIDKTHYEIAAKSTIRKAMSFVKKTDLEPPYLLIDTSMVKKKVRSIGRNIKNSRVFYAVKANPDIEILSRQVFPLRVNLFAYVVIV